MEIQKRLSEGEDSEEEKQKEEDENPNRDLHRARLFVMSLRKPMHKMNDSTKKESNRVVRRIIHLFFFFWV